MKFAFVSDEKVAFPIAVLCRVMDVSTSGFYASQCRPASPRAMRDAALSIQIMASHEASKETYGSPRIREDLIGLGERVGRNRITRIMREKKLKVRARRKFRVTTDSKHKFPIAPNILQRDFTAAAPNESWVTDITFLWTTQGWLYLAVILDLFSRRVVGWATSENVDRHLALAALNMAIEERQPGPGLVHHSDRGSTYAAGDYRKALKDGYIECSMSRKGDCWDNAVAESFFATLKREMPNADDLESRASATLSVRDYIQDFYNARRRHSSISYHSPIEFELLHEMKKRFS